MNLLAREVAKSLLERHPAWAEYFHASGGGDLELAIPAPPRSRARQLVVSTNHGKEIWLRFGPPRMLHLVDSLAELHKIVDALLEDEAVFTVIMRGDDWVETTLLSANQEPRLEEGQTANLVSWSGSRDRIMTYAGEQPSLSLTRGVADLE
jgi:hypothetical protein